MRYVYDGKVYTLRESGSAEGRVCDGCAFNFVRYGRELEPKCMEARLAHKGDKGCNGYLSDNGVPYKSYEADIVWMTDADYALWRLTK